MNINELRSVGESVEVGDKIRIGALKNDLTVVDRPIVESGGSLIFAASQPNYPEDGIVTQAVFSLGPQSSGVQISEFIMEEGSDEDIGNPKDYVIGEQIRLDIHDLQELSIVK